MSATVAAAATNVQALHKATVTVKNKKLGIARQPSPDSEALLSSDDDHEPSTSMSMSLHSAQSVPPNPPVRRGSWLSEVRTAQRKYSLGGISLASGGASSHPSTPVDSGHNLDRQNTKSERLSSSITSPWEHAPARPVGSNSSGSAWDSQSTAHIWSKRETPRWMDFNTSPSHSHPAFLDTRSPSLLNGVEHPHSAILSGSIPFDIPLQPNRKTVRSQSYSVGQLEFPVTHDTSIHSRLKTKRNLPPSPIRRKSRPILADSASEFDLASVQEDATDSMETSHRYNDSPLSTGIPLLISPRSDKMHVASSPFFSSMQDHLSSGLSASNDQALSEHKQTKHNYSTFRTHNFSEHRRLSMPSHSMPSHSTPSHYPSDNSMDNTEAFTDSMVTLNIQLAAREAQETLERAAKSPTGPTHQDQMSHYPADATPQPQRPYSQNPADARGFSLNQALASFSPWTAYPPHADQTEAATPSANGAHHTRHVGGENYYNSTSSGPYDLNKSLAPAHFQQAEAEQHLSIVTFKSSRADVFWIPDHLGTSPKVGDMVIVEGDRGDDLGMINHINLSYAEAKTLKQEYNHKHFQVLVRFARMFCNLEANLPQNDDYSAIGGYSPGEENTLGKKNTNLQPKFVKRIATDQEIMLLRDKEGNEARAKRICQAKINQHNLQMEILDAEFQLDYRKLTFYFYAESYINFNSIVVDLFKVWKTRIWLSAVNPETYPGPPSRPAGDRRRNPGRAHGQTNTLHTSHGSSDQGQNIRNSTAYHMALHDLSNGQFPPTFTPLNMGHASLHNQAQQSPAFNGGYHPYSHPGQLYGGHALYPMQHTSIASNSRYGESHAHAGSHFPGITTGNQPLQFPPSSQPQVSSLGTTPYSGASSNSCSTLDISRPHFGAVNPLNSYQDNFVNNVGKDNLDNDNFSFNPFAPRPGRMTCNTFVGRELPPPFVPLSYQPEMQTITRQDSSTIDASRNSSGKSLEKEFDRLELNNHEKVKQ